MERLGSTTEAQEFLTVITLSYLYLCLAEAVCTKSLFFVDSTKRANLTLFISYVQ